MRLKQLWFILLPVILCGLAAADSQVTGVAVQASGSDSVIAIRANGPLVHNEYRPADNLLLIDLAGVSVAKVDANKHSVNLPGVVSYRVSSYQGAQGIQVARIEVSLEPRTTIHLQDTANGLLVRATPDSGNASRNAPSATYSVRVSAPRDAQGVAPKAAAQSQAPAPSIHVTAALHARPIQVSGISLVRSHDGMDVEIHAVGVRDPKAIRLISPDRIVVDLPNAVMAKHAQQIQVHSDGIKDVRMSQYQAVPPVTRVVVDLTSPHNFELDGSAAKWTVKVLSPASRPEIASGHSVTAAAPQSASQANGTGLKVTSAKMPAAQDFVVIEPGYTTKGSSEDKHTGNMANAAMKPATMNAAFMEAAAQASTIQPGGVQSAVQQLQGQSNPTPQPAAPTSQATASTPASSTATTSASGTGASVQYAQGPAATVGCNTGRYTGEPISVNLKDVDLKDFFRLIHDISGLNVVLDPGVNGSLTLVLDDVPWDQALGIVLNNNGLECQLSGNVLRIALPSTLKREADQRRAAVEAQALAVDKITVTRYLSYAAAKDVVPTIKQFLSQRGDIISDERTNGLIISDIPSVIPNIDRLLRELDRKTPEVEIEARVIAASRNFARDLGTQIGASWKNNPTSVAGAPSVGISPGGIPLFSNLPAVGPTSGIELLNLGRNYRLDMILTAAESRGLLKILSRPRVVTQNNIQALVRQGVRIPVVTLGQLGGPPTVQYVDAFLRLQVRPQITAEGTIFLNVDVENTTPDFAQQVQGNPTLITQQATTQVLVKDGGTVVIGGVIQTQDSINYSQVPLLGSIPVLGNLFKRKSVQTNTQELIFFLTPKIIQT